MSMATWIWVLKLWCTYRAAWKQERKAYKTTSESKMQKKEVEILYRVIRISEDYISPRAGSSALFKMGVVTDEKQQSSQEISFWNSHQHNQTLPGFLGAVSSIHFPFAFYSTLIYNYKKNISVRQSQGLIFNHLSFRPTMLVRATAMP